MLVTFHKNCQLHTTMFKQLTGLQELGYEQTIAASGADSTTKRSRLSMMCNLFYINQSASHTKANHRIQPHQCRVQIDSMPPIRPGSVSFGTTINAPNPYCLGWKFCPQIPLYPNGVMSRCCCCLVFGCRAIGPSASKPFSIRLHLLVVFGLSY